MEPINGYVVCTAVEDKNESILIMDTVQAYKELKVVKVSQEIPTRLMPGATIFVERKAGVEIPHEGMLYVLVKEGQIMAILPPNEAAK